jgi:nucleoside-diphosphate-sugar epimerase
MRSLFITGASGFVGRHLLARVGGRYGRVVALSRIPRPPVAGVTWVQGDLQDPAGYASFLDAETDIAHLAAATGGASASVHRAVNAEGTEALVKSAERARVGGLLFVSSIAARFPEDPHYPYATAKREAEVIVRAGKVPFVIVRPTIVLGRGSPILDKLRTLAGGPVIAAIGGGKARVQPVDVTNLAGALAQLLERRAFEGTMLEFGGPEVLTMAELLVRVRAAMGKPPARIMAMPYAPMRGGLIAMEALLFGRSPVSAGQISSFVQDGVAEPNALWESMRSGLLSVIRMLEAAGARD